jgi:fumarate hydratase subunit alpha
VAITETAIADVVATLYERVLKELPDDVMAALKKAHAMENNPIAKSNLAALIENAEVAKQKDLVLCQDTCLPSYWLKVGTEAKIEGDLGKAIKEGTQRATQKVPLIPHCVHPITRVNTGTNTNGHVPILHTELLPNCDYVEITAVPIGAGCETAPSSLKIFSSSEPMENIKRFILDTVVNAGGNPCPPTIVGVGIGTSFDYVAHLAKIAALRPLDKRNPDPVLAEMEEELLKAINETGIGPMGMGGDTTSLAVNIEIGHTHTPCQPVAVKLQCWAARRMAARIHPDGKVEII